MRPNISIIIPVYNGEAFIKSALDILLQQATPEIEVVLIDDGSTDSTAAIVKQHFCEQLTGQQLKFFTQENQGVSAARNLGIDHANGDYIGFVDADDLVLPEYIAVLLQAIESQADIVEFGLKQFTDDIAENNPALYSNDQFGLHPVSDIIERVYCIGLWYPVTRIFKKQLFTQIRFPVGVRFCEDLMTLPKLYEEAQTILVIDTVLYGYRTNLSSATYSIKPDYIEKLVDFYRTIPFSGTVKEDYLRMSVAYSIISCQKKAGSNDGLPDEIQKDLSRLRGVWQLYYNIEPRRIMIVLFPQVYMRMKRFFNLFK